MVEQPAWTYIHPHSKHSPAPHLPEDAVALDDVLDHLVLPQVAVETVAVELTVGLYVDQQPLLPLLGRLEVVHDE